jgi:hypothetical protein
MLPPFDELPFRSISTEALVLALMTDRGETLDDVTWISDGLMRAADFSHAIMLTKRSVYTLVSGEWTGDGAITTRVWVADRESGHD